MMCVCVLSSSECFSFVAVVKDWKICTSDELLPKNGKEMKSCIILDVSFLTIRSLPLTSIFVEVPCQAVMCTW